MAIRVVDRELAAVQCSTPAVRLSVALVDNDTAVRRAVQLRLQAAQCDVRAFASGWAMLAETGPQTDCVVVRDQMGEIDGFDLLRRLRDRGWRGPAVLLTRMPSRELTDTAARAGFAAVIDRPLIDDIVSNAVAAAVRSQGDPVA